MEIMIVYNKTKSGLKETIFQTIFCLCSFCAVVGIPASTAIRIMNRKQCGPPTTISSNSYQS